MSTQLVDCSVGSLTFHLNETMNSAQAKEYAMQQLKNGNFKNCTIGKVFVNGELVLENVKTS